MKNRKYQLWAGLILAVSLIVLPATFSGCGTTAQQVAYKSAATTSVTAETAVRAYNVFAAQGKTTVLQNAQVKAAYEKYQAAFAVLCDAGAIYAAGGGTNAPAATALQQAVLNTSATITDVVNLVKTFGVKL